MKKIVFTLISVVFQHSSAFQTPSTCNSALCSRQKCIVTSSHGIDKLNHLTILTKPSCIHKATSTSLSSSLIPSSLTSSVGSLFILAFVILIHEAGHFLAARSFNIKVDEFSVGIGPKLAGFVRNGQGDNGIEGDGGIEFNLRALPLGGYVRFPENYNVTLGYQLELQAQEKRDEIQNIVDANRKDVGDIGDRGLWDRKGVTKEERIAAMNALDKKNNEMIPRWRSLFSSPQKNTESNNEAIIIEDDGTVSVPPTKYYDDPDLLQNRPWTERAVVLVGGVVFNLILSFSLYFGELSVGPGMLRPTFQSGAVVSSPPISKSASAGILERGDVILSLNGEPLSEQSPTAYDIQDSISKFISNIRATVPGNSLHLSVLKAKSNELVEVDITPIPASDDVTSPLSIGVRVAPNFDGNKVVKATSTIDAVTIAGKEVFLLTSQTTRILLSYLGGLISGAASSSGQSLSGPIGVIKTGSDVVSTYDINAVIGFAAAVSINLAVVNSLPLPALDGGQLIFVLSEVLTGKKFDQKKQEAITSATLLFLFLVTISTTIGDVSSLSK